MNVALAALFGLLCGRCLWDIAHCYEHLLTADATDAPPDAHLLGRALRGAWRLVLTRAHTDGVPAWRGAIPAAALAVVYALLTVYASGLASAVGLAWAVTVLLLLALIDARTGFLPDALTLPLLWTGLAAALLDVGQVPLPEAVAAVMIAYAALYTLAWLFLRLRGRDGMGGGDIKLLAAIGAWVGVMDVFWILLCASVSGLCYALTVARSPRLDAQHPFGPHLAGAAIVLLILRATGTMELML